MAWLEISDDWRGDDHADSPPIRLMHHDARWRQEFEQTRSSILLCCEGRVVDVQHIGGTALPGLIARPVIDVIAVVEAGDDMADAQACIEGLNFRPVEGPAWANQPITLEKPRHGEPTHRVLLVLPPHDCQRRAALVRDHFRNDHEAALSFEQFKVDRWRQTQGDPVAYEEAKNAFFEELLTRLE